VGTKVALFENVNPNVSQRRDAVRGQMVRAAVSIEEQIRYSVLAQELVEEYGPLGEVPTEVDCSIWPVEPITTAEVDAVNHDTLTNHLIAQKTKKRSGRALQKYERTL